MKVNLPSLGEGVEAGTVVNILVSEGDRVSEEQDLLEIESDKAVASLPSPSSGTVTTLHVSKGQEVSEGDTLLEIDEDRSGEEEQESQSGESGESGKEEKSGSGKEESTPKEEQGEKGKEKTSKTDEAAPPSVRRTALNLGIDLSEIPGSGKGGRIEMKDLQKWISDLQEKAREAVPPPSPLPDFTKWGEVSRKPLRSIRKTTARRMAASSRTIPQVTQFGSARTDALLKSLSELEKAAEAVTVTAILIKLLPEVLKDHPFFNASFDAQSEEVVIKEYYNIGVATATRGGLVVPVISKVDRKSVTEVAGELKELASTAREGELDASAMEGGSFTISNQGGIGGDAFTPIINPPETAILGVGKARKVPVLNDDKVEAGTVMPLCLTYDHRVADGAQAAAFMEDLVSLIENLDTEKLKGNKDS